MKFMKKIILMVILLFFGRGREIKAQDIQPSEQAKGYLEGKNVTVDYSTGIFYYTIPIFDIKSGNYSLPIGLQYIGKGVKVNDKPGFVGLNWALRAGGIITRTIRGGIADEVYGYGIANMDSESGPLLENKKQVHKHKRDGESDLFSVVFNDKSIDFIILNNGYNNFVVQPLEKTNIKIEYVFRDKEFKQWKLTDENGIVYIYSIPEYTANILVQEPVGNNSIYDGTYISSWHISQIIVPNADTIHFHYDARYIDKKVDFYTGEERNIQEYLETTKWTYNYGNSMLVRPFNFSKYEARYNTYIDNAKIDLISKQYAKMHSENRYTFDRYTQSFQINPLYYANLSQVHLMQDILGVLHNIGGIAGASTSLVYVLNNLITSTSSGLAKAELQSAKLCLWECLEEEEYITTKETYMSTGYRLFCQMLQSISTSRQNVEFKYSTPFRDLECHQLDSIIINYLPKVKNKTIILHRSRQNLLDNITWKDENNVVYQKQNFLYHDKAIPDYATNRWGDYGIESQPLGGAATCYSKLYSLKQITLPLGGHINVDYEQNWFAPRGELPIVHLPYSGIRVKNIVLETAEGTRDSIKYYYPLAGVTTYYNVDINKKLYYSGFQDVVDNSRMFFDGIILKDVGNKGVIYPYVEEEIAGKGKNTYLFLTPSIPNVTNSNRVSPYWLYALPLAKGVYDTQGNLISIQKNKYYADLNSFDDFTYNNMSLFETRKWIETSPLGFLFANYTDQILANNFYIDPDDLDKGDPVVLYRDGSRRSTYDPRIYNGYNFNQRVSHRAPYEDYKLFFGGKVVLKEQKTYMIMGNTITGSSINHLVNDVPTSARILSDIEFIYDNHTNSVNPTRIVQKQSNGDELVICQYRVTDFQVDANPFISQMRQSNMLSPVLKEQTLLKRSGDNIFYLIDETVHEYEEYSHNNQILPKSKLTYQANLNTIIPTSSLPLLSLYSKNRDLYREEQVINYKWNKDRYVISSSYSLSDTTYFFYDQDTNNEIMHISNVKPSQVDVIDRYRSNILLESSIAEWNEFQMLESYMQGINRFLLINENIDLVNTDEIFQRLYATESYQDLLAFCKQVCRGEGNNDWINQIPELYRSLAGIKPIMAGFTDIISLVDQDNFVMNASNFIFYFQYAPEKLSVIPKIRDYGMINGTFQNKLSVSLDNSKQKYVLYFVIYSPEVGLFQPTGKIRRGNQITEIDLVPAALKSGTWQVVNFVIDVSQTTGSSVLEVDINYLGKGIALGVLVPQNASFEAISYSVENLITCKLKQNGIAEIYRYDSRGRLLEIRNQNGFLVKEYQYNTINN